MAITITTNTLSTNAKYINYSSSTTADDCADIVVAVNNVLVDDFGWEKYDSAGAGTANGTSGNRFCIWRKPCYDFATTGHYMYLGMRLSSNGSVHHLYFNYSADRSTNNTFTGVTNMSYGAANSVFNSQTEWDFGANTLITFGSSGTIWLFNDFGKSLVMCFLGSNRPIGGRVGHSVNGNRNVPTTIYFGQYNKDFGEVVPAGENIHNGVVFGGYSLWSSYGQAEGNGGVVFNTPTASMSVSSGNSNPAGRASSIGGPTFGQSNTEHLFVLTEYSKNSSISSKTVSSPVAISATTSVYIGTRMLLGWIGWVGHVGRQMGINAAGVFTRTTQYSATSQLFATGGAHNSNLSLTIASTSSYTPGYWWNDKLPGSTNSINLFEPVISAGAYDGALSSGLNSFFYGKMYGVRITGGQPSIANGGYTLLDSATIPLDANGFYDPVNGTNTDCWCVPIFSSELITAVDTSACMWVKK